MILNHTSPGLLNFADYLAPRISFVFRAYTAVRWASKLIKIITLTHMPPHPVTIVTAGKTTELFSVSFRKATLILMGLTIIVDKLDPTNKEETLAKLVLKSLRF